VGAEVETSAAVRVGVGDGAEEDDAGLMRPPRRRPKGRTHHAAVDQPSNPCQTAHDHLAVAWLD
jgi:hypothetical protein